MNLRLDVLRRADVGPIGVSFLDQAAYGLSTFLVTAVVSSTTSSTEFSRFIVLWTASWTLCALATELLVTPLRVAVPRGDLSLDVVENLQGCAFVVALSSTVSTVIAIGLGQHGAASVLATVSVALSGLSFTLRRSTLYTLASVSAAAANSAMNLTATVVLLAAVRVFRQSPSRWGLVVASMALLLPLVVSLPRRWPSNWRIGSLLLRISRSGGWLAIAVGLRGLVYTSGLLALVARRDGLTAAAVLGYTFVLASPVQLVSSALPLLLMPSLVRSYGIDGEDFGRTFRYQLRLYLVCASVALVTLFLAFDWWRGLLVNGPEAGTVAYLPVALCVLGILFSSWLGDALLAVRPPAYSLATTVVGACSALVGLAVGVPAPYLAPVPYGAAILAQFALVRGRAVEERVA